MIGIRLSTAVLVFQKPLLLKTPFDLVKTEFPLPYNRRNFPKEKGLFGIRNTAGDTETGRHGADTGIIISRENSFLTS